MAGEATIRVSLNVKIGNLDYRSNPTGFRADVSAARGPTPGIISIPTTGIAMTFAQLVTPGLCWIQNLDTVNFFEVGIKDPGTGLFYPMLEWLAGEYWPMRLSRNLLEDYYNTGTGTSGDVNNFWFKANGGAVLARVDCFEK